MKLATQPRISAVEFYPPAYRTPQHLANVDRRFQIFLTYFIPRRVFFDNLLTRLIQTIREHLIPPPATQLGLKSRPSKLCLGENIKSYPLLNYALNCHINSVSCFLFSAMAKPSKKQKFEKPAEEPKNVDPEQHARTETEDHPVTQDAMDVDPENDKPPSPPQPAHDTDDIMITGTAYQAPGNPIALSKHIAKEEFSAVDKGKWKVDLEGYSQFSAQEIHSGYLNRLHTSRDFEAGLVNLMKEHFEVSTTIFSI